MSAAKVPVSILIPIKNEAANLPRCLASVAWADEIFVVDSQSTDGSQAIVEAIAGKADSGNETTGPQEHGTKSNIEHSTSNIQHRTSNIQHPTSNIELPATRERGAQDGGQRI